LVIRFYCDLRHTTSMNSNKPLYLVNFLEYVTYFGQISMLGPTFFAVSLESTHPWPNRPLLRHPYSIKSR
jgi:hypothetical protein